MEHENNVRARASSRTVFAPCTTEEQRCDLATDALVDHHVKEMLAEDKSSQNNTLFCEDADLPKEFIRSTHSTLQQSGHACSLPTQEPLQKSSATQGAKS